MHMTLQSLSHSSNGSLQASYPFGESREVTREEMRVRPLATLPFTRSLSLGFRRLQAAGYSNEVSQRW